MNSLLHALAQRREAVTRDELLACAERLRDATGSPQRWALTIAAPWANFDNRDVSLPKQGWKLHLSATHGTALKVLEAVVPLLLGADCSFKFAASRPLLRDLNDGHTPRGSSGKFLTIYPRDDSVALELAERCDRLTHGLAGPRILSDRAYRDGGIVHYRYGAFALEEVFNEDGLLVKVLRDPEGRPVPDARNAWFTHPPWAEDPFVASGLVAPAPDPKAVKSVLLHGRYHIERAVRHANKGGIYQALDQETGAPVILKEARPHVASDRDERDVRDYLRLEAENLRRLEGLGFTPRLLDMFAKKDHLFLVLDVMPGVNLRRKIAAHKDTARRMLPPAEALDLARQCAAIMLACHDAGLLIVDFTPNNLMVKPDGSLGLIDLELACPIADPRVIDAGTPAYVSPQRLRGEPLAPSDDVYSLGAVIFFIAALQDPLLVPDRPAGRTDLARLTAWLDYLVAGGAVPDLLAEAAVGALAPEADARWSAARVMEHLARPVVAPPVSAPLESPAVHRAASGHPGPAPDDMRAAALDAASHALAALDTDHPKRPFDSLCRDTRTDPCCIQHGAAGVGWYLALLLPHLGGDAAVKLRQLAAWTLSCMCKQSARPAGLYFGSAGAAWFLLAAARALGDDELHQAACDTARSLPLDPRHADLTHGAAGIGMTLLHFHRETGRAEFLARAREAAELVIQAAQPLGGGLAWPRPMLDKGTAILYGFAHGNAGIGYFLLAMHAATGDPRYLATAIRGFATLLERVEIEADRAYWHFGPERPSRWPYWCNGSSGVGTALLRAYQVTGNEDYRRLAEAAARAVVADLFLGSLGQCHGLAGNGEFLLDMADVLGERSYREMAWQLAGSLYLRRVVRDGQVLFPDDSGASLAPDFGIGTSGIGAFCHRLACGGGRPFMVDELLTCQAAAAYVSHGAIAGAHAAAGRA